MDAAHILIVDDNAAVRRALRSLLRENKEMQVVVEAGNGLEAIQENERLRPDLIILDVSMPVVDGITAASVIRKNSPRTAILLFSLHNERGLIDAAKRLGLSGCVAKDEGETELLKAVHAVLHNRTYFPC